MARGRVFRSAGDNPSMGHTLILIAGLLFLGFTSGSACAQSVSVVPDAAARLILVRSTLIALDQANKTGNYGVFRDLGSPRFRGANSEARLAAIFSNLRNERIDMGAVVVIEPHYTHQPFVDKKNLLRLTGVFGIRPRPVQFDLAFELAGGEWRLFGLAVNPIKSGSSEAATKPSGGAAAVKQNKWRTTPGAPARNPN